MRRGPATTRTVLRVHPPERESVLTQSTGTIKSSSPGSIAQVAIQPVPAQLAVVAVSAGCTTQPFPLAHAISASWCIGRCQRWMQTQSFPLASALGAHHLYSDYSGSLNTKRCSCLCRHFPPKSAGISSAHKEQAELPRLHGGYNRPTLENLHEPAAAGSIVGIIDLLT